MKNRGGMSELTEGCVANIISFTSPRDACRFSVLSSLYRSAADSDIVWDRFLPPDFESLIAQSPHSSSTSTKKQLYFTSFLIENGRKSVWLDKLSGKKCYMLSARDLRIVEGDNPRHWRWTSDSTSRFEEVAELLDVLRLEINGKLDAGMLSPSTLYASYFVFKLASDTYGLDHEATEFAVGFVGRGCSKRIVYFQPVGKRMAYRLRRVGLLNDDSSAAAERIAARLSGLLNDPLDSRATGKTLAATLSGFFGDPLDASVNAGSIVARRDDVKERVDGWLEIELGEFESEFGELEMHVKETRCGVSKRGLIVGGIEIRPKHRA